MGVYDYSIKIILLGDYGVGKSAFVKYLGRKSEDKIGCCCIRSHHDGGVELEVTREGKRVLAKVTDTGSQERYRSLTSSYYRGAQGCILMFDTTREESFHNIQNWYEDLETYGPNQHVSCFMVGNKCFSPEREVTPERAQKHAEHLEVPYYEIDVNSHYNVDHVFEKLIDMILVHASRSPSLTMEIKPVPLRSNSITGTEKSCCAC